MKLKDYLKGLVGLGAPTANDRQYWYDESGEQSAAETFADQEARQAAAFQAADAALAAAVAGQYAPITAIDAVTGRLAIGGREIGDTGNRNVASLIGGSPGVTAGADPTRISRCGNLVTLTVSISTSNPDWVSGGVAFVAPLGFRCTNTIYLPQGYSNALQAVFSSNGNLNLYGGTGVAVTSRYHLSWRTNDAWPTVLPGTAA